MKSKGDFIHYICILLSGFTQSQVLLPGQYPVRLLHCSSLRFPFFALLLTQDRVLPNTSKSLGPRHIVTLPYLSASLLSICLSFFLLHGHQSRSFSTVPTIASNISHCLLCAHFHPVPYSTLTPLVWTANFSSQYNHTLGSVISKNSHPETHLPPPFLPHLAFSLPI